MAQGTRWYVKLLRSKVFLLSKVFFEAKCASAFISRGFMIPIHSLTVQTILWSLHSNHFKRLTSTMHMVTSVAAVCFDHITCASHHSSVCFDQTICDSNHSSLISLFQTITERGPYLALQIQSIF